MICPLKMINPQNQIVIDCEERCALRLVMPYDDYQTEEGNTIEYCGLIYAENIPITLKNVCFTNIKEE